MNNANSTNNETFSLEQIGLNVDTGTQFENFISIVIGPMDHQNMSVFLKTACSAIPVSDGYLWINVEVRGKTHTFSVEKGGWDFI
ncbi:MAG: hypothetical protein PHV62_03340 [Sulfuricurvum sp.]|nr:hypothetical protein [Sulfuricurvum sp.]